MKNISFLMLLLVVFIFAVSSCNNDDDDGMTPPVNNDRYSQEDQMGRPAINTVFVTGADKDVF
jgi:hypothetical protein